MAKELIKAQSFNPHIKDFDEYKQLYDESINNPQGFFKKIAKENLSWIKDFNEVHNNEFAESKWFYDGKINVSENCIDRHLKDSSEKTALIWEGDEPGDSKKYTFNYDAMKSLNENIQMRSDWYLPICSGHERLKNDEGKKLHPTQKPEGLLHRVIISSTNKGEVILDPFFGTGTTGAVAKRLSRKYIGIEKDKYYVNSAKKRIGKINSYEIESLNISQSKKAEPRIPFGWLIERKLIEPGTVLYDNKRKFRAKVRADGSVISSNNTGSIHQIGAEVQSASACNGWNFLN